MTTLITAAKETTHQAPLSFFRSPFFVLHPNELCALDAGSVSGLGWYIGWGHGGVFLCKKYIWESLHLGIF